MLKTAQMVGARADALRAVRMAAPSAALAVLLTITLRAPFVGALAYPDEGGLLLVARAWHRGGPELYGDLFVDRPPLLLLFWKAANVLGGVDSGRLLGCAAVATLVVAAAWSGWLVGGRRGSRWAGFSTAALASNPILGAMEIDAELLAAPLTLLGCSFILMAARPRLGAGAQGAWALMGGIAGAGAALMKQNLVEALVFGAVLAIGAGLDRSWSGPRVAKALALGFIGAALPVAMTVLWATARAPGLDALWHALYGFRGEATGVIAQGDLAAPEARLLLLGVIAVLSGMAVLVIAYLYSVLGGLRCRDPLTVATVSVLAVEAFGLAAGGSYWPHYLLGLLPGVALATASLANHAGGRPRGVRGSVVFVVVSAVVAILVSFAPGFTSPRDAEGTLVRWLRAASGPADTALVLYGHPNIVVEAGMGPSDYPYLWSLPMRTLDPRLHRLRAHLSSRSAPTWVVEWVPSDTWELDRDGAVLASVGRDYSRVATICGVPVFLHRGVSRALPSPGRCP